MKSGPLRAAMNRRQFLGCSAQNAAGVAAGVVGLAATVGQAAASEAIRVGVIGVRNQGKDLALALGAVSGVQIQALSDIDESVLQGTARACETQLGQTPRLFADFRRLLDDPAIDAVVIATPDHWHAAQAQLACDAGKHVYLEAPVTHRLEQTAQLQAAGQQAGVVVQCGLQQRSGEHFQTAIEHLHGGRIGRVLQAKAWTTHVRKPLTARHDTTTPPGVDYLEWLGPAQTRAFHPHRFHHHWRWFWDYGSGELGQWGVHLLDVARWGLQVEWPQQVMAAGGKLAYDDEQETPDTLTVQYQFAGQSLTWEHRLWSPHGQEGRSAAVAFYGDKGTLIVDRGGWKIYGQADTPSSPATDCLVPHVRNFVAAIRGEESPRAPLSLGLVSSGLCHLGNAAYRLGAVLSVNSQTGQCPAAEALV